MMGRPSEDRDAHDDNLASAPQRSAKPGEIITFGVYAQTADGADRTPIKWQVLQSSGGELFLLSEYILDCKRYHGEYVEITWRDCDLRKWLNDEFYHTAFTAAEQGFVKTTRCTDNGEASPDTEDKVFLLGVAEVKGLTDMHGEDLFDTRRRAVGTGFAKVKKADGCHLYVYNKGIEKDYIVESGERHGCSWWWLRTQGNSSSRAFFVGARSSIRSYGRVNLACYGVRPALRIELEL